MDFATKFNRLSGDMAFRAFRGNQSGNPDDEAQLFGLIQECFTNLEMKSVRLSEIPKMFEGAYARSLTTKRKIYICITCNYFSDPAPQEILPTFSNHRTTLACYAR
jgi:hypothetical protein